jgi:hypothetical protein
LKFGLKLIVLAGIVLILAACGGGDGDSGNGEPANGGPPSERGADNGEEDTGLGPSSTPAAGEVAVPGGVLDEQTFRNFVRQSGFTASGSAACRAARDASQNGVWDLLADPTTPIAGRTAVPAPAVTPRTGQPPNFARVKAIILEECDRP